MSGPDGCAGLDGSGHPIFTISCAQMALCFNNACACDECGCGEPGNTFAGVPTGPGTIDLLFDVDSATGTFQLMRAP